MLNSIQSLNPPQLTISYRPFPIIYHKNGQGSASLINTCENAALYGVPFDRWTRGYQKVEGQINALNQTIHHFISNPKDATSQSIQKRLPPIQLNDSGLAHALKRFHSDLFHSKFNIKEITHESCLKILFTVIHNIRSAVAAPPLFQFGFLLNLQSDQKIVNFVMNPGQSSPSTPSNGQSKGETTANTHSIEALLERLPTADEGMRKQINALSEKVERFKAMRGHHPKDFADILEDLERISLNVNESNVVNDFKSIEKNLPSPTSLYNQDLAELREFFQNGIALIKYFLSYRFACLFQTKEVSAPFNETALNQSDQKKAFIPPWAFSLMASIVTFVLGALLSKKRMRIQTNPLTLPLKTDSDRDSSTSQATKKEQKGLL